MLHNCGFAAALLILTTQLDVRSPPEFVKPKFDYGEKNVDIYGLSQNRTAQKMTVQTRNDTYHFHDLKMTGGEDVDVDFVVYIKQERCENIVCGGVLLASNWVLTSAKPLAGLLVENIYVHKTRREGVFATVVEELFHPKFTRSQDEAFAAALLQLTTRLDVHSPPQFVKPVIYYGGKIVDVYGLSQNRGAQKMTAQIAYNPYACVPSDKEFWHYFCVPINGEINEQDIGSPIKITHSGKDIVVGIIHEPGSRCLSTATALQVSQLADWITFNTGINGTRIR